MRLTESQLKSIIKQEIKRVLKEDITLSPEDLRGSDTVMEFGVYVDPTKMNQNSLQSYIQKLLAKKGFSPFSNNNKNISFFTKQEEYDGFKNTYVFAVEKIGDTFKILFGAVKDRSADQYFSINTLTAKSSQAYQVFRRAFNISIQKNIADLGNLFEYLEGQEFDQNYQAVKAEREEQLEAAAQQMDIDNQRSRSCLASSGGSGGTPEWQRGGGRVPRYSYGAFGE